MTHVRKTAVELLFDEDLESSVVALLHAVRDAGLPSPLLGWRVLPHVSLVLGAEAGDGLERAIASFAAATDPIPVTLDAAASFPGDGGVVYLAPVVDRRLLDLHEAAHEALGSHLPDLDPLYRPGRWMPHCTVTVGLDERQIGDAIAICRRAALPRTGRFTRVGIHDAVIDPAREGWDRIVETRQRGIHALGTT